MSHRDCRRGPKPGILVLGLVLFCAGSMKPNRAQARPTTLTIEGHLPHNYNSVGLFRNGGETTPYREGKVTPGPDPFSTPYRVKVRLQKDLLEAAPGVYATDMRFWYDSNGNGKRDDSSSSACVFVVYDSRSGGLELQVYGGSTYAVHSSTFQYDPK